MSESSQPNEPKTAAAITKASKSNLALAFVAMGPERRKDITLFYAFCRLVDDIADDNSLPVTEKRRRIELWRESVIDDFAGEPPLAASIRELIRKYMIEPRLFKEILDGVEMDLAPRRYATFEELQLYCYRVAGAVGLISIEIFGYRNQACKDYAEALGTALQLTNILRDVREDWDNGERIYLPMEDLKQFEYTEQDVAGQVRDERFLSLMNFESDRALSFYEKASRILPSEDRRSMLPARIMANVYGGILRKMRADEFQIYEKRYRLGAMRKAMIVAKVTLLSTLGLS